MKILIAEDTEVFMDDIVETIKEVVKVPYDISKTTYFKEAQRYLYYNNVDIFICDHNMPFFEDSRHPEAIGHILYRDTRRRSKKAYFIHYSYDPCPEKYRVERDDVRFFSGKKRGGSSDLKDILNKIIEIEFKNSEKEFKRKQEAEDATTIRPEEIEHNKQHSKGLRGHK